MTILDLLFLLCAVTTIGVAFRLAYLVARRRTTQAASLSRRLAIGIGAYVATLVATSLASPGRETPAGTPQCFDDFCIAIDGARRVASVGATSSPDGFVLVRGTVSSLARRPQRETDVRGTLIDARGRRYEISNPGQSALRAIGDAGHELTDVVEPRGSNPFTLVFEVPPTAEPVRFVVRHGWFPRAVIIGDDESLLHRPTVVPLPVQ